MIKKLFYILLLSICMTSCNSKSLSAQKLELFGGVNNNVFHNYMANNPHFSSTYYSDYGHSAGFGLDSIKIDWLTMRFTLQFDNYKGNLVASDGGLGGGNATVAKVDKSLISIGLFPINYRILDRIDLNLGFLISGLLYESFSGTISGWQMSQPNWSFNLQDKYNRYSSRSYFGFQTRLSYDFKLSKSIWVSPQYLYYFGLSNEFIEFPTDTKAFRHNFCLGIKKRMR